MKYEIKPYLLESTETAKIQRYAVICALLWTLLLSGLFVAYIIENRQSIDSISHNLETVLNGEISLPNSRLLIQQAMDSLFMQEAFIHAFVWLLGLGFIWLGTRKIVRTMTLLGSERNKLSASEEKFRTVADHTYDWEYWRGADGSLVYVSPSCERITGYTAEEFQQNPELLTRIVHPDDLDKFNNHLDLKAIGVANANCQTPDFRIRTRNGQECWIEHICQEVFDKEGNSLGRRACNRDITERKQAEKERILLEQQFHHAQKLESLGVLAGGIAHDFNNILSIIQLHCHLAREDILQEDEYLETFKQIEIAGNRAADLCGQMLTYAGKSPLVQTQVNLYLLIDEVVKMLQAAIRKNITILLDLQDDVPEIEGDSGQIQQIVMNLIINAAESIGDANGTAKVTLSKKVIDISPSEKDVFGTVVQPGSYACLTITDTGCGMDEETQKRIFEPFYTTKFTGRGLGMSAIRGIVRSHHGILHLTSLPGVGTTFKVCFPVAEASVYVERATKSPASPEQGEKTILLVDDEQSLLFLGTTLLNSMGFSVLTAQNGGEALEIYLMRGSDIDLVMLDLVMPNMGGIETYHELRKISPTLPIIVCSGYGAESVEDCIKNDPYAAFEHKPYNPGELRQAIVKMIG